MSCYLCNCTEFHTRPGGVRDNSDLKVLECCECGLVYLSSFAHIDEQHYENSGMHEGREIDVSSWIKETQKDDDRRYQFLREKVTNRSVLDFGCGNGGFLEKIREIARNVNGIELEAALQPYYDDSELAVFKNLNDAMKSGNKWDVITAFHVVEHLMDPKESLKELSSLLAEGGEIVIEVPSSNDALLTLYNNSPFQKFTYWSQHLFLFNVETFGLLVEKSGLKLKWIKNIQRYSLANHLYWLAYGKPGGHKEWSFLDESLLNMQYESQLAAIGKADTIIAGVSL